MVESKSEQLDLVFHALSDSTRRSILRSLSTRERPVTEVAKPFDMSLAAVSKHITVLEKSHLVVRRKVGSYSYIRLNAAGMRAADKWMEYYRAFWTHNLENLKNFIEKDRK